MKCEKCGDAIESCPHCGRAFVEDQDIVCAYDDERNEHFDDISCACEALQIRTTYAVKAGNTK